MKMTLTAPEMEFDEAVAAFDEGDYVTAVRKLKNLAEQEYPGAQYRLGTMYSNGQGVPQDYVQAHMWYNLAAFKFPPGRGPR